MRLNKKKLYEIVFEADTLKGTVIVTSGMIRMPAAINTQVCPNCLHYKHDDGAIFC